MSSKQEPSTGSSGIKSFFNPISLTQPTNNSSSSSSSSSLSSLITSPLKKSRPSKVTNDPFSYDEADEVDLTGKDDQVPSLTTQTPSRGRKRNANELTTPATPSSSMNSNQIIPSSSSASSSSSSSSLAASKRTSSSSSSLSLAQTDVKPTTSRKSTAPTSTTSSSSSSTKKKKKNGKEKYDGTELKAKIKSNKNEVLARVNKLQEKMVADGKKPVVTLADLKIDNVKTEVADLDDDDVRGVLERVVVSTVQSILAGTGFSYMIPSRSSNNQLYVPELDRIVLQDKVSERVFANIKNGRKTAITTRIMQLVYELCKKSIHVTKRDLFYTDVNLFQKQAESDDVLDDVACMLGCTRSSLNVVASDKGIVVGQISFRDDGDFIDCTRMGVGGKAIPPYIDRITDIQGNAKFILLVEKDAAFMRLSEDRFYNQYPCIIITAKGQPDVATRLFLKKVRETLKIPVLGLVDSDPYGLKILSVYMSGSKNMSYDSASLTTPDIKWLGVRPSDLDKYKIPQQCRLPMTEHDITTGKQLLEEEFIKKNPAWYKELELMVQRKEKAEIQALSNFGFQYLTQVYLPLKLQEGDWI